jgi:hypothetical protein
VGLGATLVGGDVVCVSGGHCTVHGGPVDSE